MRLGEAGSALAYLKKITQADSTDWDRICAAKVAWALAHAGETDRVQEAVATCRTPTRRAEACLAAARGILAAAEKHTDPPLPSDAYDLLVRVGVRRNLFDNTVRTEIEYGGGGGKSKESLWLAPHPNLRIAAIPGAGPRQTEGPVPKDGPNKDKPPPPKDTPSRRRTLRDFEGRWAVDGEVLTFRAQGGKMIGTYRSAKGGIQAVLAQDGRSLVGTWTKQGAGSGRGVYTLSADATKLQCQWWHGQRPNKQQTGYWTAKRIR